MRTIEIKGMFGGGHTVTMYDSIKDLPAERSHEFNKLILQDIGVGSTMDSIANHFSALGNFLVNKKSDEALQEAKNLHNNFYNMIQKINIKSFCFVALLYKIDNDLITDLSDEATRKTIKRISQIGMMQSEIDDIIDELKKNLTQSFEPIFLIDMETKQ